MKISKHTVQFAMFLHFWLLLGLEVNGHIAATAKTKQIYVPGDVILGGLFTLHVTASGKRTFVASDTHECRGTFSRRSFQTMQGMLLAVRQINANKELLPGIKIGVDIKDTCGSVDLAVRESLNFSFVRKYFKEPSKCAELQQMMVPYEKNPKNKHIAENKVRKKEPETVAIIGPELSEIARAVSDLAGLFDIPVVSPSATSEFLGDRKRFKHFFRTVASDTYQTRVIANLLTYFNWNYVILLTSDDEYGRSGRRTMKERMEKASPSICTVIDSIITSQKIPQIVRRIKAEKKARVIILFADTNYVSQVTEESKAQGLYGYTWIASDAWTGARIITKGNEKLLQGMLGVGPLPSTIPGFKEKLLQIATVGSRYNAWAEEFGAYERHSCGSRDLSQCILGDSYEISPYVGPTIDAVYAVAYALHSMLGCTKTNCKNASMDLGSYGLVEYLKNVKFLGVSGREVSFDWFGSGSSSYQVLNLQKTKIGYNFTPVADWHFTSDAQDISKRFKWRSKFMWNSGNAIPLSACSIDCQSGQRRRPQKIDPQCCWTCVKCGGNTIANKTNPYNCAKCPAGYWPNSKHIACVTIEDVYMKWDDTVMRIILSLACVGVSMVIFTALVFHKFRTTPIVKAASRGLCYVLLVGVSLLFLLPFTLIGRPSHVMCKSLPFTLGLCLSLNVGTMLVKTNRIARIFSKRIMERKTHFLSSKWQYFLVFIIVATEEVICLVWLLALSPPAVESGSHIDQISRVLTCNFGASYKGLAIWSSYNAGLILVCTYQAFLVRKVPHNYNEAKFIAFTMVSICITILVYIPVHVGAVSYSKDVICSFLYTFVATFEFSCIFAPKLYIILLRPSKNIEMQISESFEGRSIRNSELSAAENSSETRQAKRRKVEAEANEPLSSGKRRPTRGSFLGRKRSIKGSRKGRNEDENFRMGISETEPTRFLKDKDDKNKSSLDASFVESELPKSAVSISDGFSSSKIIINDDKQRKTSKDLQRNHSILHCNSEESKQTNNKTTETILINELVKKDQSNDDPKQNSISEKLKERRNTGILFPRQNKYKINQQSNKTSLRRLLLSGHQKQNESTL